MGFQSSHRAKHIETDFLKGFLRHERSPEALRGRSVRVRRRLQRTASGQHLLGVAGASSALFGRAGGRGSMR